MAGERTSGPKSKRKEDWSGGIDRRENGLFQVTTAAETGGAGSRRKIEGTF